MTLIMVVGCGYLARGNGHYFSNGRREDSARHFKRNCTRDQSEARLSPKDMLGFIYIAESIQTKTPSVSNT
jgi:hypothetical protein